MPIKFLLSSLESFIDMTRALVLVLTLSILVTLSACSVSLGCQEFTCSLVTDPVTSNGASPS